MANPKYMKLEIPEDRCQTTEPDKVTAELADVTQTPSRDWQIGCNLNKCLLNVYTNDRWTDMIIRCGDKEVSRPLKAHKLILAARSPVFEAMLYGLNSDGRTEYDFPKADVDIFDMMLKFMYTDDGSLTSVDEATDLIQMAHMYQITSLVDHCAQYLHNRITVSNVCKSLDCALKYSTPRLRDACCDFIDRNVKEVIKKDGFRNMSKEGLAYILKGDTFFADEDIIFSRVVEWAKLKLSEVGKEENGQNIRNVLGEAFYHLRLSTLSAVKLLDCITRKGYFSLDEHEDIMNCSLQRRSSLSFVSNVRRVPLLQELVTSLYPIESDACPDIDHVLKITIYKDLHLEGLTIPSFHTYIKHTERTKQNDLKTGCMKEVKGQIVSNILKPILSVVVTIDKINFEKHSTIHQQEQASSMIVFDKPVLLMARESPFDLRILIEPMHNRDASVLLVGNYGKFSTCSISGIVERNTGSSKSEVISVTQTEESMIGIYKISIRNCSFREKEQGKATKRKLEADFSD